MTDELDAWVVKLAEALGLDPAVVDCDLLLDLARDAAHGVTRPAAPLTTFLVGLAAGADGADRAATGTAPATDKTAATDKSAIDKTAIDKAVATAQKLLAER